MIIRYGMWPKKLKHVNKACKPNPSENESEEEEILIQILEVP
jgi:hypothetical protein